MSERETAHTNLDLFAAEAARNVVETFKVEVMRAGIFNGHCGTLAASITIRIEVSTNEQAHIE